MGRKGIWLFLSIEIVTRMSKISKSDVAWEILTFLQVSQHGAILLHEKQLQA